MLAGLTSACGEHRAVATASAAAEIELTQADAGPLLEADGTLRRHGWSPHEYLSFNREAVAAPIVKQRRWDFFTVMNASVALDLTVTDIGFISIASASITEFGTGRNVTGFAIKDEPGDVFELSASAHGLTRFADASTSSPHLTFDSSPTGRHIVFDFPAIGFSAAVSGDLFFAEPAAYEYLALATPFAESPTQFFYEQKIPGMPVTGSVVAEGTSYTFTPADSYAVMDWGRGVWPDEVFWEWGQAAGTVDGVPVALNIGGGFGDMSAASENIIVYNGKVHKLGSVDWTYDDTDAEVPWHFAAPDGRVNLTLTPFYSSDGGIDLGARWNKTLKAYGWITGTLTLDSGQTITVRLLGFAERVRIKWG